MLRQPVRRPLIWLCRAPERSRCCPGPPHSTTARTALCGRRRHVPGDRGSRQGPRGCGWPWRPCVAFRVRRWQRVTAAWASPNTPWRQRRRSCGLERHGPCDCPCWLHLPSWCSTPSKPKWSSSFPWLWMAASGRSARPGHGPAARVALSPCCAWSCPLPVSCSWEG